MAEPPAWGLLAGAIAQQMALPTDLFGRYAEAHAGRVLPPLVGCTTSSSLGSVSTTCRPEAIHPIIDHLIMKVLGE